MKKLCLVAIFAVFSSSIFAQDGMRLGLNAGLPIGDAADFFSFNASADLAFLWGVSDNFSAGITAGYSIYFGEKTDLGSGITFDVEDASFIPIAGTARFNISDNFRLGVDLGYAIGISPDGNDGGFYYAPRVHYGVSEALDIVLSYRGISNDGNSGDVIALGLEFGI